MITDIGIVLSECDQQPPRRKRKNVTSRIPALPRPWEKAWLRLVLSTRNVNDTDFILQ